MGMFIDILIIGIIFISIFIGFKKGFVHSVLSVMTKIVSFIISFIVSSRFAPLLYNSYFRDGVIRNVESRVEPGTPLGIADQVTASLSSIPNVLAGAAKMFGVDYEKMETIVQDSGLTADIAESLESVIVGPVVMGLCKIIIFAVVSAIVTFALGAIVNIISGLAKLPVLRQADGLLGAAVGIINGILVSLIVSYFLVIAASLLDNSEIIDIIDTSNLVALFAKTNLFI